MKNIQPITTGTLLLLTTLLMAQDDFNSRRKTYLENDSICNCQGLFDIDPAILDIHNFQGAIEAIDTLKKTKSESKEIQNDEKTIMKVYYFRDLETDPRDSTIARVKATPLLEIYHKENNIKSILSFRADDHNSHSASLKYIGFKFGYSDIGKYLEFDKYQNLTNETWLNHFRLGSDRKMKKRYPICWKEAYELAKLKAGVTGVKPYHTSTRGDLNDPHWYIGLDSTVNKTIYRVSAKTGKIR